MPRKNQVLTWHMALCVDCRPPAVQSMIDERARDAWLRHHHTGHTTHHTIVLNHAGYGGEQFAARDAVTKLITALNEARILLPKAEP